jgi:hypothetical protein
MGFDHHGGEIETLSLAELGCVLILALVFFITLEHNVRILSNPEKQVGP